MNESVQDAYRDWLNREPAGRRPLPCSHRRWSWEKERCCPDCGLSMKELLMQRLGKQPPILMRPTGVAEANAAAMNLRWD